MKKSDEMIAELNQAFGERRDAVEVAAVAVLTAVEALGMGLAGARSIFGGIGITSAEFSAFCGNLERVEQALRSLKEAAWRFSMLDSEFLRAMNGEIDERGLNALIRQRTNCQMLCGRYVNRFETVSNAFLRELVAVSDIENKGARCKRGEVRRLCSELKAGFEQLIRNVET